jgi:hypothetical protein|eukprot:COSAG06_NODE_2549_length_6687_cov_142.924256_6_plen_119_part_00
MMNDVNLSKGLNRYYVIQVLKLPSGYQFFRHEGKVGLDVESVDLSSWGWGQSSENYKVYPKSSKEEAVDFFKSWFTKKTGNSWDTRHAFKKVRDEDCDQRTSPAHPLSLPQTQSITRR